MAKRIPYGSGPGSWATDGEAAERHRVDAWTGLVVCGAGVVLLAATGCGGSHPLPVHPFPASSHAARPVARSAMQDGFMGRHAKGTSLPPGMQPNPGMHGPRAVPACGPGKRVTNEHPILCPR